MSDISSARLEPGQPPAGSSYSQILSDSGPRWRAFALAIGGPLLGLLVFYLVAPMVIELVLWVSWWASGSPGSSTAYFVAANAFQIPAGMLATNLGLAMLIPVSAFLVIWLHRRQPRWLISVKPGLRWPLLAWTLLISIIVFGLVLLVSRIGQPWVLRPEAEALTFLVVILMTSPLQAAAEEVFFRGYLMQALQLPVRAAPWFAVLASAGVFALLHGTQNVQAFLYRFGFGILAGLLVSLSGGLEAAIAAHAVNNVFAYGGAVLTGTVAQLHATTEIGWPDLAWGLSGFALIAVGIAWLVKARSIQVKVAPATRPTGFGGAGQV